MEKEVFELNGATTFAHAHAKKELSPKSLSVLKLSHIVSSGSVKIS